MKSGSKYYPLYKHLQTHASQTDASPVSIAPNGLDQDFSTTQSGDITLTLSEIEQLIKTPLPPSASKRAWWSNRDSPKALQANAWVQAGYHVKIVDFEQQIVTFTPFTAEYTIQRADNAILWNQDAIRALRKYLSLTQAKFAQELGVRRQTVSEWENGVYEPDRSTAKHLERLAEQQGFESQ